ncbi:MAG: hypothetical protein BGP13_05920 [Sphingobacteriales bacterium 40-81]|nr:MAG: hypothetical protein BGP13_05920 [Sphingobacteriales bacterium 40-81]
MSIQNANQQIVIFSFRHIVVDGFFCSAQSLAVFKMNASLQALSRCVKYAFQTPLKQNNHGTY